MQICHERTAGIEQDWCLVSANALLLHSDAVAIKSVPYWIAHLQCCVLITHGAVVKVQGGCNVHDGRPALVCRENAPVVSTYLTVVDGSCIMKTPGEKTRG